ncbi:MAG: ankyrin repeat domain-containing protein, partial [Pseudomonadota bacterium]
PTAMAPLKLARLSGRPDIADVLESAGAESPDLTSAEKLRSALMSADGAGAQAILDGHPDLRADAPVTRWMHMAAGAGRHAAVKTMIDLEFPVEVPGQDAPLHAAAYAGDMDMARLLIAAGADTTLRDPTHNGPPLGFAMFANQSEMVQFLLTQPMDIFAAAWVGKTDVLASLVADQPNLLNARFTTVRQNTEACPDDWKTPLAVAVTDGQTETAAWLLQAGADPTVTDPDGRSIRDIGLASDSPDIRALFGEQR